ncbi:phospho-N-acetylmuramoyl-pentapeptide-transferase, partial [Ruminococcus bicirculans (ex Wegman et al. 2014)]
MFYNLLAKTNNTTLVLLVPMLCSFLIAFFSLKFFKRILPKDQGRAFAVNGALSEGKPRGAGIIFVTSFTLCTALFYPLDIENIIYLVLVYAAMLSGYFDDAAETPWGNLKKGLIDLVISLGIAFTYYFYNGSQVKLYITNSTFTIPVPLFIILAGVLVWTAINVTNCTDGVDGLCGSLVMTVLLPLAFMVTKSLS